MRVKTLNNQTKNHELSFHLKICPKVTTQENNLLILTNQKEADVPPSRLLNNINNCLLKQNIVDMK